ncbi:unnamed protein product [Caenorhabditis auriculariae]|uniref:SMC hinge domain-containing protein n=1 Tax=Caenorhabditis auriculariae TaxID=2777116 RepID=A0A8S1HM78_9PELO|nr:unnamed protein product [Caenorhabditis auriculariae]
MFIKEVIISGFRSYKDNTRVDGFSPRHNVVVGRNGSGKSNFFFAIQFVLSDEFSHLKEEQKLGMLHESTGPKVAHARVEIVFDNTDHRIVAIDSTEVVNLMESAGFSRSNPYYIVKQGKINELATSPDSHRLKLLREVAGTRVYDERKEESLKILKETKIKTAKIEELLRFIEERLKTLENEKEDLKEYQKWDKTKRGVEYAMYDSEIQETKKELSKLADQREELTSRNHRVTAELAEVQTQAARSATEKRKLDAEFKGMKEEKESLVAEETDIVAKQAQLQLKVQDLTEETAKERDSKSAAGAELQQLRAEILQKQTELEQVTPEYEKLVEKESSLSTDIRINETRMKELLAKQGHRNQFGSAEDRDKFLTKEVKRLKHLTEDTQEQIRGIEQEVQEAEIEDENFCTEIQNLGRQLEETRSELDAASNRLGNLNTEQTRAVASQMGAAREEKHVRDQIVAMEAEIGQTNDQMRRLTPRPTYNGLQGVLKVLAHFRENNGNGEYDEILNGYHGTIIDLMYVEKVYFLSVEVIAQSRLFYHVVDNDRIASKILRKFNEMQLPGEITISRAARTPDPCWMSLITTPDMMRFFRTIFGGTALVRKLDQNAHNVRNEGFDCVTLDGDQLARRGALTGGYLDAKRCKLEIHNAKRELDKKLNELKLSGKSRKKTNEMENIRSQIHARKIEMSEYQEMHRRLHEQKRALNENFNSLTRDKEPKKAQLVQLRNRLRELFAQQKGYEAEIGSELHSQLTSDEQNEVERIRAEIAKIRPKLDEVTVKRSQLEVQKRKLDNQLKTNLLRKQENLSAKIDDISDNERHHLLQSHQGELTALYKRLMEVRGLLTSLEDGLSEYEERSGNLDRRIEDVQEQMKDLEAQLVVFAKESDSICTKHASLQSKREDSLKKMRQLGTLPTDAFSKYQNMSYKQLEKRLTECINELKKYENVNKKALDQYLTAAGQKENLTLRMEEQKKSESSIEELLKTLELRKYEAIQLTFKQVSKNFKEVFKRLVPHGQGTLIIQMRDETPDEVGRGVDIVERFTGIGILVSFTSDAGDAETREMQQLSGGQKSLVALALIFSIQMCDPAPFYLFDEIDAALDAQHRKAVADMIHSLCDNAQFITTTFRPELLASAEKYYGVRFRNKVSHIDVVTKTSSLRLC